MKKDQALKYLSLGILVCGMAFGCRTKAPATAASALAEPPKAYDLGAVVRVNESAKYVVLKCAVLPSDGEQVTVYRNGKEVGRLKVSGPRRPPFLTADIVGGEPREGDRVRN